MEGKTGVAVWILAAGLATPVSAGDIVKVDGYLEYKKPSCLIVDAQRVQFTPARGSVSRAGCHRDARARAGRSAMPPP
jgi:hypothetical protein